ncbi:protein of unknown function [Methylocella tundrae]|uniref:Uncharacterized protein n=1 Tax=Methylocella tundrae TaxID=227605 RepID=A0A4U8YU67_METTU|nr:protein of unknown function [Methylocella tundrae]
MIDPDAPDPADPRTVPTRALM